MRCDRRAWRTAVAVVTAGCLLTLATITGVRWLAAGDSVVIVPPAGATERLPEGGYESVVDNETADVYRILDSDRGKPAVGVYAMPPATTPDQVVAVVAGQLDGWRQRGDCADTGKRVISCRWEEQARWWPRTVRVELMRPPPTDLQENYPWPDITVLIIGSGRG
ncbi:hypothetical protein [Actinoplanes missouriensis]|uniref:hypothetical protein n=1 Tax=Actinoplanes missouriensis TaxID=1866 RepID=UPI0012FB1FA1|nr:hypothetical protein [Actinoplanes missouriensis]